MGMIFLADDGLRVLQGAESALLYFDAIGTLFRGEPGGGLAPFPVPEGHTAETYLRAVCEPEFSYRERPGTHRGPQVLERLDNALTTFLQEVRLVA